MHTVFWYFSALQIHSCMCALAWNAQRKLEIYVPNYGNIDMYIYMHIQQARVLASFILMIRNMQYMYVDLTSHQYSPSVLYLSIRAFARAVITQLSLLKMRHALFFTEKWNLSYSLEIWKKTWENEKVLDVFMISCLWKACRKLNLVSSQYIYHLTVFWHPFIFSICMMWLIILRKTTCAVVSR